jgi:uncharacterized protein
MDVFIKIISIILILLGIVGAVAPFLPGPPLAFLGLLLYGIYTHFHAIGWLPLVIFGILTIVEEVVGFFAPALGAKGYKSTRWGFWGSVAGGAVGIFVFPPLGIILGPFVGAFVGEFLNGRDTQSAFKIAKGALIGLIVGSIVRVALCISMLVYFIYILVK